MNKVNLYTEKFLNGMRFKGDPLADAAVADLFDDPEHKFDDPEHKINKFYRFLMGLKQNVNRIPGDRNTDYELGPNQKKFFAESCLLPVTKAGKVSFTKDEMFTGEEINMIDEYCTFFNTYGFRIFGLLYFKSLPTGYMCPLQSKVLNETELLSKEPARRVLETAQFIFDVSKNNWYKPDGNGIRSIQKVRLVHAGMRHLILNKPETDQYSSKNGVVTGIPVNQEDMVLTCQLFSLAILRGLEKMGAVITDREKEVCFFNWRVVGLMLGIDPEIMPDTFDEGWDLQNKIYARQIKENNDNGPKLNTALIEMIGKHTSKFISYDRLKDIELFFLDEHKNAAKCLDIKPPSLWVSLTHGIVMHLISAKNLHKDADDNLPMKKHTLMEKIIYLAYKIFGKKSPDVNAFEMAAFEYLCKTILASVTSTPKSTDTKKLLQRITYSVPGTTVNQKTLVRGDREGDNEGKLITDWKLGKFNLFAVEK